MRQFEMDIRILQEKNRVTVSDSLLRFLGNPNNIFFFKDENGFIYISGNNLGVDSLLGKTKVDKNYKRIVIPSKVASYLDLDYNSFVAFIRMDSKIIVTKLTKDKVKV